MFLTLRCRIPWSQRQEQGIEHSSNNWDANGQQLTKPGILLLTHTLQLFFINHEARDLISRMGTSNTARRSKGLHPPVRLPREIKELGENLQHLLTLLMTLKHWEQVSLHREVATRSERILLRGSIISPHHMNSERFFHFLLEPITDRGKHQRPYMADFSEFTLREQTVLTLLAQGLSNQDIAHQLGISIHTVKERVRTLIVKTHACNRTEVLSRVLSMNGAVSLPKSVSTTYPRHS